MAVERQIFVEDRQSMIFEKGTSREGVLFAANGCTSACGNGRIHEGKKNAVWVG